MSVKLIVRGNDIAAAALSETLDQSEINKSKNWYFSAALAVYFAIVDVVDIVDIHSIY